MAHTSSALDSPNGNNYPPRQIDSSAEGASSEPAKTTLPPNSDKVVNLTAGDKDNRTPSIKAKVFSMVVSTIKSKRFSVGAIMVGFIMLAVASTNITVIFHDHPWLVLGSIISLIGLCRFPFIYRIEKRREKEIREQQRQQEIIDEERKNKARIPPHNCDLAKWEEQQALEDHHRDLKTRTISLNENKRNEHQLTLWFKRGGMGLITIGVALTVAAIIYGNSWLKIVGASSSVLAIGFFAFSFDHRTEERRLNSDIKQLRFECDLLQLSPKKSECRAEKALGNNDSQLRSYYELNLEQCSKIFWVGILCLVAGVGVIAATLYAVKKSPEARDTQIIIGVVGAVGAVLINYVAAIFLKMHSEILTILKEFQSKLVDTQELYLANVLVSRISKQETQENALKALSLAMVQHEKTSKTTAAEGEGDAKEVALNQYTLSVHRNARSGLARK